MRNPVEIKLESRKLEMAINQFMARRRNAAMFASAARRAMRAMRNGVAAEIKSVSSRRVAAAMRKALNATARLSQDKQRVLLTVGFNRKSRPTDRSDRPGVGLTNRNIHWAVMGTKQRATKRGANRGAMPAYGIGIIERGVKRSIAAFSSLFMSYVSSEMRKLGLM